MEPVAISDQESRGDPSRIGLSVGHLRAAGVESTPIRDRRIEGKPRLRHTPLPRAGKLWLAGGEAVDLMETYESEGRRLWPTVVSTLGSLLEPPDSGL